MNYTVAHFLGGTGDGSCNCYYTGGGGSNGDCVGDDDEIIPIVIVVVGGGNGMYDLGVARQVGKNNEGQTWSQAERQWKQQKQRQGRHGQQ